MYLGYIWPQFNYIWYNIDIDLVEVYLIYM